jgi:hypothetical protein
MDRRLAMVLLQQFHDEAVARWSCRRKNRHATPIIAETDIRSPAANS